jgi:hypothetical protein
MLLVGIDDTLSLVFTGESSKLEHPGPNKWVKSTSKDLKARGIKPTVFTVGGMTGRMRARIATSETGVADRIYDFCQAGVRDVSPLPQKDGAGMAVTDVVESLSLEAATLLMSVIMAASEGEADPLAAQDTTLTEDTKKKD